jgi:hypothetical protein
MARRRLRRGAAHEDTTGGHGFHGARSTVDEPAPDHLGVEATAHAPITALSGIG